jgi:hypothetical protein
MLQRNKYSPTEDMTALGDSDVYITALLLLLLLPHHSTLTLYSKR